jgi:phosphopantothenate synthetase
MKASDVCENSWFQFRREKAAETISDQGTYLATTLNPLSRSAEEQMQMLDDVTNALRRCTKLAYPSVE